MTNLNETLYGCELVNDAEAAQVTGGFVWILAPGYALVKAFDWAIGGRAAINLAGQALDDQICANQNARIARGQLDANLVHRPH